MTVLIYMGQKPGQYHLGLVVGGRGIARPALLACQRVDSRVDDRLESCPMAAHEYSHGKDDDDAAA